MTLTRSWRIAFVAMLMVTAQALAAEGPTTQADATTQPTPEVIALVNDLTSDQYITRQTAQKKLEGMGQSVVPQLQEILNGNLTDEAQARVRAALRQIQEVQDFGPSVITIHCHDAPPQGVLEDFANQAGKVDLGLNRPEFRASIASRKVSLDLDHADFWTALRTIEGATGLHARPNDGDGRLILDNMGGWFGQWNPHARTAGPCMIIPQAFTMNLIFGPGGDTENMSLQLIAMVEPKLHVVGFTNNNWVRECVDEKGNSLVGPSMEGLGGFYSNSRQWLLQIGTNLKAVPGMGEKIARLKGELTLDIQTKSELVTVDNILSARNVSRSVAGNTITIQECVGDANQYRLTLRITGPAASGRWDLMQEIMGSLSLLDDKDQPLQQGGQSNNINNGQMTMVMTYFANRPGLGPPAKLRWEITTETRRLKVPFELDDLELRVHN